MSNERSLPPDEVSRHLAEQRRELAERQREEAEGQRQLLETIRREREELREAEEAQRVSREEKRVASEVERAKILEALRENTESLSAISVRMKTVEDMRRQLHHLITNTKETQ